MDKIKINNQVVAMRKYVKQGKIRIINKFVKEIQLLRNRKGGEQKIAKSHRKADRLLEEVAILKKIKPDTVSRLALSKSKDWKAVLSQKGVSQEDRCHALLASYGPVQEEVEKFYSENYYLTPKIPTLIQEWEEKTSLTPRKNKNSFEAKRKSTETTKSNPSNAKEDKFIKVTLGKQSLEPKKPSFKEKDDNDYLKVKTSEDMMDSDSRDEVNQNFRSGHEITNRNQQKSYGNEEESESDNNGGNIDDHPGSDDHNEESGDDANEESGDDNEENSGDDNEENSDDANEESGGDDNEENSEDQDESHLNSDDEGNTSNNDLKNINKLSSNKKSKIKSNPVKKYTQSDSLVKSANDIKNKIPSLQKNVPLNSDSTKAVALVNLNELMDMDEIPIVSSNAEEKLDSQSKKRKKDSFFLKDGGEEFSESDEDSNEKDGTFSQNVHGNSVYKKGSFPPSDKMKREENSRNFRNTGFSKGKKVERGDRKFRDNFPSKQKFNKFVKNDSKPYSDKQNFKKNNWNKDDGKGSKPFANIHEKKPTFNKNKSDNHPRSNFGKTVKKDEPPLHPSWEAKRKMKQATNTKFQGKRIVFND